jgi:hypothetical protein
LLKRIFILILLVGPAVCLTSLQANDNGPHQLETAAKSQAPVDQQTSQAAPGNQAPLNTKDVEGDVIALCSHTLRTIELVITIAATVVGLLSLGSVGLVLLYPLIRR